MKRFSEGFFLVERPRQRALDACDAEYQHYASVAESARASRYLSSLPHLSVFCPEMDGDFNTLPIIFEDVYVNDVDTADEGGGVLASLASSSSAVTESQTGDETKSLMGRRRHSLGELNSAEDKDKESERGVKPSASVTASLLKAGKRAAPQGDGNKPPRPSSVPSSKKLEDGVSEMAHACRGLSPKLRSFFSGYFIIG